MGQPFATVKLGHHRLAGLGSADLKVGTTLKDVRG